MNSNAPLDLPNPVAIHMLGVRIHSLTSVQLLDIIKGCITNQRKVIIAHVNVHGMNFACKLKWFREFLNTAEIVFCDGFGIILGARILGHRIQERITYADWSWELDEFCEKNQLSLFLLGGQPGVAELAAEKLQNLHPKLVISGTQHGYFNKTTGSAENEHVIQTINSSRPNILLVGFGMPLQEQWLVENWDDINANVALTVGGAFGYVSGDIRRGPEWLTKHGFEWLARLWIEPKRLWKRYLVGNPVFLWRILMQRLGLIKFE
jgi:N-acetylglucosaminyldiphosphoundecaprenol N-acetyl-beta-D-mannosaminyltransferase